MIPNRANEERTETLKAHPTEATQRGENRGLWMVLSPLGGVVISVSVLCWMYGSPELTWKFWMTLDVIAEAVEELKDAKNPPWLLLSGLATAPAVLLTWWWRNSDKAKDHAQKDQELDNKAKDLQLAEAKQKQDLQLAEAKQKQDLEKQETDVKLALQRERNGRFSDGVRLLAEHEAAKLASRLGGIYTLAALGKESKDDLDRVVATLCAFVRTNGQFPPMDPENAADPFRQPEDVQAAFTMIVGLERSGQVDLRGAKLCGLEGIGAKFSGANLSQANLMGAKLIGADLSRADLSQANLVGTDLTRANLHQALLMMADLRKAILVDADLSRAGLSRADLHSANLHGANLASADLSGTKLERVNLFGAKLEGVRLIGTDLRKTDLSGAIRSGPDIPREYAPGPIIKVPGGDSDGRDLAGQYFDGMNLQGADLVWAKLQGVNLQGVKNLSEANLAGAEYSATTKFPSAFDAARAGMVLTADQDTK